MTFGPGRGVDFETFSNVVKRLTLKVISSEEELLEVDLPMEFFNVPVYQLQVQVSPAKASPAHTGAPRRSKTLHKRNPPRDSAQTPKAAKKTTATQTATAGKRGMVK